MLNRDQWNVSGLRWIYNRFKSVRPSLPVKMLNYSLDKTHRIPVYVIACGLLQCGRSFWLLVDVRITTVDQKLSNDVEMCCFRQNYHFIIMNHKIWSINVLLVRIYRPKFEPKMEGAYDMHMIYHMLHMSL